MKQLMLAMKRAQAKRAAIFAAMVIVCVTVIDITIMDNTEQDLIILAVSFGVAVVIGVLLRCFCCYERVCLRKINKLVAATPNSNNFFDTFAAEMSDRTTPNYYNKEYRLSIFATETWFVLIAADDSIIRRRDDLKSTERKLIKSDFTHAAKINFANGDFLCHCDHIHEDVIAIVRSIIRDDTPVPQDS